MRSRGRTPERERVRSHEQGWGYVRRVGIVLVTISVFVFSFLGHVCMYLSRRSLVVGLEGERESKRG